MTCLPGVTQINRKVSWKRKCVRCSVHQAPCTTVWQQVCNPPYHQWSCACGHILEPKSCRLFSQIVSANLCCCVAHVVVTWFFKTTCLNTFTTATQFEAGELSCVRLVCRRYRSFLCVTVLRRACLAEHLCSCTWLPRRSFRNSFLYPEFAF